MNEYQLKEWRILASENRELRYPKISLGVMPPLNYNRRGVIRMETFVTNKDKTLLVLVSDAYETSLDQDIWETLVQVRKAFDHRCEITKEKYIFNKDTAISEPFK